MLAEDRRNLNWHYAFYMRFVIFAHKKTISEDGCKRMPAVRQLSSEYKFRREEERVGYKGPTPGGCPHPLQNAILEKFLIYLSFKIFWARELKFYFDAEEKINCARYVFRRRNWSSSKCGNRMTLAVENSSGSLYDMKKNTKSHPALHNANRHIYSMI
ncbi:hypothetical protein CDAR_60341 [Caerostris darwini]|uniref:Uncharacterized protein n=1 Tax=Caerostris darwini TaxID=1538125 RepID=A0AAV4QLQ5_9ARAC|nr:hypothetical protein CDAR_60341 [Caerostris darwini]